MDYIKVAVTVIVLLLPLVILLCELWSGWRNSDSSNNIDNASRQSDSVASASGTVKSNNPLPLPIGEYEVFLNFRGPDTRDHITDILYRFLVNSKIRTFKDDDELRKGEGIWPSLVKAMEQSKIYVPIFSKNYAYSKWCLRELAAIVARQERNQGCIILPIFYMVDPGDVRNQTGPYQKTLRQHERNFDEETIRSWKDALTKVGALKGWHVKSIPQQGAIADLVTGIVWSHLSKNSRVPETDKLVGIDDHIEAIKEKMALDSPCVTIVGIHGMGGIGKTTIAKAVYNKVVAQFDRCSFVDNVREMLRQVDGAINLQKHIISDILGKDFDGSVVGGRDRVSKFKFLIVLDDVDEKFEFDVIFGNMEKFEPGSKFIITSRNVKVLSSLTEACKLYRVHGMSRPHALQLFCKHAFRKDSPRPSFETLSEDIVSVAAGLPLTLKIVGSLLFEEKKEIWIDKLRQLKEIPEEEVVERLKISYDTLNEEAKQIFLDIACFFIGEEKDVSVYMWSDCGFSPAININILIQRSMIEIVLGYETPEVFGMHDQLRDMGREIVRQENIRHPWKRSRIWSKEKALDMLLNKKGTDRVEGIRIKASYGDRIVADLENECFTNLPELRYFYAAQTIIGDLNDSPNLRWLQLLCVRNARMPKFCVKNLVILQLCSSVKDDWGGLKHIKMASNLKVLEVWGTFLSEYPDFPRSGSLERLNLLGFGPRLSNNDLNIGNLNNLKEFYLSNCEVGQIWGGTIGMMQGLQYLRFSGSTFETGLREAVADIGDLQFLKVFTVEVTDNVGGRSGHENVLLGIKLPTGLEELEFPYPVANLQELLELEELEANGGCEYDIEIPPADGSNMWWKLSKLKKLSLTQTKITIPVNTLSPSTLSLLPSSLTSLHITQCPELEWFPNLENLEKLTDLHIDGCYLLKEILGLGRLKSLEYLTINGCDAIRSLPSMASLSKLLRLEIKSCRSLTEIQGLGRLKSLQTLKITLAERLWYRFSCIPLLSFHKSETLTNEDFSLLASPLFHDLDGECRLEDHFPRSGSVEELYLQHFRRQLSLNQLYIGNLRNLKVLSLGNCQVVEIRGGTIGMLKGLEELHIIEFWCEKRLSEVLADIGELQFLRILTVTSHSGLSLVFENLLLGIKLPTSLKVLVTSSRVANLPELVELDKLEMYGCRYGLDIPPMDTSNIWWKMCKLKRLTLRETKITIPISSSLRMFPSSLTTVNIYNCLKLEWLPNLKNLENLTELIISICPLLKGVLGLGGLKTLETICGTALKDVCDLDGFGRLYSLKTLRLSSCGALERLPSMASLSNLLLLNISSCPRLTEIQGLGGLKSLQRLLIDDAKSLTRLLGFGTLLSHNKLEILRISRCPLLTLLPFRGLDWCISEAPVVDSLQKLHINGAALPLLQIFCLMIQQLMFPSLTMLSLGGLKIGNADKELRLDGLESMEKLAVLRLYDLASLRRLPSLSKLGNLKWLTVENAPKLQEIEGLAGLKSLEKLDLTGCTSLERLPADQLSGLEQLESLDITGCTNLIDLYALAELEPEVEIWWPDSDPTDYDNHDVYL